MLYEELDPHPALRASVRCLWTLRGSGADSAPERVVPDGCAELVLNRGARFRRFQDGGSHVQAEVLLVGQIRTPISIAPTGAIDLIGVRFEPGGLHALLNVPMHELADVDVCLGQVDGALHRGLRSACARGEARAAACAVQDVLLARLRERERLGWGDPLLVAAAVRRFETGRLGSDSVARELGVSRRTLERAFRDEVGLSPRLFRRIRRLHRVLGRLDTSAPGAGWAHLAAEHGYADQSHLIREFRQLVGTTPARYLEERTPLASFFDAGS